jgi:hypothetical protein
MSLMVAFEVSEAISGNFRSAMRGAGPRIAVSWSRRSPTHARREVSMSACERKLAGLAALLTRAGGGCTSSYTAADLAAEERRQGAADVAEEERDEEVGEEGGANEDEIQHQMDDVDGASEEDF